MLYLACVEFGLILLIEPCQCLEGLERYAAAIHAKESPLTNCWGFIYRTVRPVSRPGKNQRVPYDGHKRVDAITIQSIATPDGLVAILHGP